MSYLLDLRNMLVSWGVSESIQCPTRYRGAVGRFNKEDDRARAKAGIGASELGTILGGWKTINDWVTERVRDQPGANITQRFGRAQKDFAREEHQRVQGGFIHRFKSNTTEGRDGIYVHPEGQWFAGKPARWELWFGLASNIGFLSHSRQTPEGWVGSEPPMDIYVQSQVAMGLMEWDMVRITCVFRATNPVTVFHGSIVFCPDFWHECRRAAWFILHMLEGARNGTTPAIDSPRQPIPAPTVRALTHESNEALQLVSAYLRTRNT